MSEVAVDLLVEAGAVLAISLDPPTTMGQIARLTIPRLADLCVIDLCAPDGSIKEVAVAATQEEIPQELERLRREHPLDPRGGHPVAQVIRSGEPILLAAMTNTLLSSFAQGSEHARFMIDHGYSSAVVAPLLARGRTLGALSILRLGEGEPYGQDDLDLAYELARRAALAIDNARLFSELRDVEQRLEAILFALAEAITLTDEHDRIVFANQAAAQLFGKRTPLELIGMRQAQMLERFLLLDEHGHRLDSEDIPHRGLFEGESPRARLFRCIEPETGAERWLLARPAPLLDPESQRVRFAVNVYEDVTEVKRAQLAESFMAEASSVLASSMDYPESLGRVARLAVPQLADWCAIDLLDDREGIQRVASHHVDPAKLELSRRLRDSAAATLQERSGVAEVIRTGQPRIFTDIHSEQLSAGAYGAELRGLDARAAIIVPMAGARQTIGAITLASSGPARSLSGLDLGLAVRLGRRAGTTVENARLYTERTRIAQTLQQALLPESLPAIPGAEVEVLYSAAGELNEVGGDFYDVLEYGSDSWMLVIGDVCGKGPRAAGVTALTRHTLRAAAMNGQTPTGMLLTLHQALQRQPPGADLCTVCLVTLAMVAGKAHLSVALAGHHQPLVITREGEVRQIGRPGTLLGVIDPVKIFESDAELSRGETLLLYTDGVPEAGRSGRQLGEAGLLELCAQTQGLDLAGLLQRIERVALERAEGKLRDDIALLGVRL